MPKNKLLCLPFLYRQTKKRTTSAATGLRVRRYFRHLQICRTAANAAGRFRLSCEKGGGTAYAVTEVLEVLAGIVSLLPPNSPSVAFGTGFPYTTKSLRRGGISKRQNPLSNTLSTGGFRKTEKRTIAAASSPTFLRFTIYRPGIRTRKIFSLRIYL